MQRLKYLQLIIWRVLKKAKKYQHSRRSNGNTLSIRKTKIKRLMSGSRHKKISERRKNLIDKKKVKRVGNYL